MYFTSSTPISITILFSLFTFYTSAQVLPDSTITKIDKLFADWKANNGPGFTIGIVRNDSLIYSQGYGMANMEYSIPNSPETIYHMASVSKQFTAYCILLLEKQGRLNLHDDVRKYLSWFPDLKEKISIRNLLNHTSGIRDQWELAVLSGTRIDDVITQDYIITLLNRQQALNFKPGEEFSYSNSNYTMLAEIVKTVSGQSFRQFADSAIFKPLGMKNTHVHDDHTEVVAGRAYSYRPLGGVRFSNIPLNYANYGATSLFSNIPDMAKWVINFYDTKVGDAIMLGNLTTQGILNSGRKIPYAAGIIVDDYRNKIRFSHSGGDAGYRTYVSVFPQQKMGFIVFSNVSNANPVIKATQLADLFIEPPKGGVASNQKKIDSSIAIFTDTTSLVKYMGNYISEDGTRFRYHLKGQQIYWTTPVSSYLLAKAENDTLVSLINPEVKFVFNHKSKDVIVDQYWPNNHRRLKLYTLPTSDTAKLDKQLKEYTGTYYSPELEIKYTFSLNNHKLEVGSNKTHADKRKLDFLNNDQFSGEVFILNFQRNGKNQIVAFELNTARIRHLLFTKTAPLSVGR
jgi:CubicO group peptidase (beta-lactamase class C family)